jgi:nicotinamide riboside kinase
MKVLIAGTFSSGKSTLISDLTNADSRFHAAPEGPRRILAQGKNQVLGRDDVRSYLAVNQLLLERELADRTDFVLVEGGLISNIAHDRALLEHPPDRTGLIEALGHERYDLVLMCDESEIEIEQDGQRFDDQGLRRALLGHIQELLCEQGYESWAISGTPADRVAQSIRLAEGHELPDGASRAHK